METQVMGRFGPRPAGEGRVTVEMGAEAYRATGARPERETFARFAPRPQDAGDLSLEAACGIGVLVEAGFIPRRGGKTHHEAAYEELGRPYVEGFAWGFDGRTMPGDMWPDEGDKERMREGQRDGRALWAAVRDGVPAPDLSPTEGAPGSAPGRNGSGVRGTRPADRMRRPRRAVRRAASGLLRNAMPLP